MGGDDEKFLKDMPWAKSSRTAISNYTEWERKGELGSGVAAWLGTPPERVWSPGEVAVILCGGLAGEKVQGRPEARKFFGSLPHLSTCFAKELLLDPPCLEDSQRRALSPVTVESTPAWPVRMLLVPDIQVFQGCDEGLGLEASGCPRHHGGVADGAVRPDGNDVTP